MRIERGQTPGYILGNLRQTLVGLVLAASPGCGIVGGDCTEDHEQTVRYAEPAPQEVALLLASCDVDAAACTKLCMKVLEDVTGYQATPTECDERRTDAGHTVTVGWVTATGNSGCPVEGRRPAGLRRSTPRGRDLPGAYLARGAHFEAASAYAFVGMARELARHGAPAALCEAAKRAAVDEVRHARAMTGLAHARGARVAPVRVKKLAPRSLEALAIENVIEGVVGETWAALIATWQAHHAEDGREIYAQIAEDEVRHAELARAIAAWAEGKLFPAARARVAMRQRRAVAKLAKLAKGAPAELRELGMPDAAQMQTLFAGARAALWS